MVGHFATEVSHFSRDDLPAMGRCLEGGNDTVLAGEFLGRVFQALLEIVETVQGASAASAVLRFPGQENTVPGNLIDFPMVFFAAVRKEPVVVPNEIAVFDVAQFFCNFGGVFHVDKHENQVFFFGVLVLAQEGIDKYPGTEFLVDRTDEGDKVAQQEKGENKNVVAGILEEMEYMVQGILVDDSFALVNFPDEDTEGQVCTDGTEEKQGTDNEGYGDRPPVHFVLQDGDVINAVGKSCKQGKLQHEQELVRLNPFSCTIHEKDCCPESDKDPTKNIEANRFTFALCQSCDSHKQLQWINKGRAQIIAMIMMSL